MRNQLSCTALFLPLISDGVQNLVTLFLTAQETVLPKWFRKQASYGLPTNDPSILEHITIARGNTSSC